MDLPPLADAMYKTWWSFVNWAANSVSEITGRPYSVSEVSTLASTIAKTVGGSWASYNPIGVSQLFGIAKKLGNAANALNSADPSAPIDASMVAEAPWSRTPAEQAALPMWQARVTMTYTDAEGVQQEGIAVVNISQVLPSSVASLQAQMELRVADQLAAPPGTGTPRTGQLDSINSITLLAV